MSQDIVDLETRVTNDTTDAVATATQTLQTQIALTDADVAVLSTAVTALEADLDNIDLTGIAANSTAIESLTTRVDADSDSLSTLSSSVTALQSTVDAIDSDFLISGTASAREELLTLIEQSENAIPYWRQTLQH